MTSKELAKKEIERIMDWHIIDIHIGESDEFLRMDFNPTSNMIKIYTAKDAHEIPTIKLFERDELDKAYQYYRGLFDKHSDNKV